MLDKKLELFVATKAFITYKGKIIIVKESGDHTSNTQVDKYDIPGGRMNPVETLHQSLTREVREEVGLGIDIKESFFANEAFTETKKETWHIVRVFFNCEAKTNAVTLSSEHYKYEWINPKDYKKYDIIENLYPAFESYLANKK
ncbi:MAG: NUDIX domain-containing protein [Candidatus Kerfeldbacteria bacterium]|jgi:ADP-ribose pyrophosphatase YjhB (NUDIX family)